MLPLNSDYSTQPRHSARIRRIPEEPSGLPNQKTLLEFFEFYRVAVVSTIRIIKLYLKSILNLWNQL